MAAALAEPTAEQWDKQWWAKWWQGKWQQTKGGGKVDQQQGDQGCIHAAFDLPVVDGHAQWDLITLDSAAGPTPWYPHP